MDGLIRRGDVWWTDLPTPTDSEAGFRRPVVALQADVLNETPIRSIFSIPLTANLEHEGVAWTLRLPAVATGLPRDSVALPFQSLAVDRRLFRARAGRLSPSALEQLFLALDAVLGR